MAVCGILEKTPAAARAAGETAVVRAGFIPLLDCAILVAAAEQRFVMREGLRLELIRETPWANIRGRIAIGHFDVAQMLASTPIASTLGIGHLTVPMIAPMALGLGGNAVKTSPALWREMAAAGASGSGEARSTGAALRRAGAVARRISRRARPARR